MNSHDRAAASELRFIYEKCFDFLYLLLPSAVPLKTPGEISFEDWISCKPFKATVRDRSRALGAGIAYDPYSCYRSLCSASHGAKSFFNSDPVVPEWIFDSYLFFNFNRWFALYVWVLEIVRDFIVAFSSELNQRDPPLLELINLYSEVVTEFKLNANEAKVGKLQVVEFPSPGAVYWATLDGSIAWEWREGVIDPQKHRKLLDDYMFLMSLADTAAKNKDLASP